MMTVPSRSPSELVNIKLHHARLLIQSASNSEGPLQRALLTGSINELYLCYQALLAEVVDALRVPLTGIQKGGIRSFPTASEWQSYLERFGRASPEIDRCAELERGMEGGWLLELLSHFDNLSSALSAPAASSNTSSTSSASASDSSASSAPAFSDGASDVAPDTKKEQNNRIAVTNLRSEAEPEKRGASGQNLTLEKGPGEKSFPEKSSIQNSRLDSGKLMQWQQNLKALVQTFRAAVAEW